MTPEATTNEPKRGLSARPSLAVVIVNYCTADLTVAAAHSTLDELASLSGVLVIVDNHSEDGSAEALERFRGDSPHRERITIVLSARNDGFAAGVNRGIEAIAADFYLLLNSDAAAEPGAIGELLAVAKSNPRAGLVTPTLANAAGALQSSRFRRHTPMSEFLDGARTGPLTRLFSGAQVAIPPEDWSTAPDWVSFAAVLVAADAIAAAGPLDEGYFLYYEDCDYCRRVTQAGFKIAFAPSARFRHEEGGSTKFKEIASQGERLPAYYYRARNRYFRRRYGVAGSIAANLAWMFGRAVARLRGLIGRPTPKVGRGRCRDQWNGWLGSGRDSPNK
ncbi:MAG: glycosyltransferase family 2 protein [Parvularculaceae bacterium]